MNFLVKTPCFIKERTLMVKENQEQNGPDFFDEVQNKIEKDIFLSKADQKEPSVKGEPVSGLSSEEIDISSLHVEIEIVDSDSNFSGMDLDDAFLEEVDIIQEVKDEEGPAVLPASSAAHPDDGSETVSMSGGFSERPEETDDLQEDDRYLGEMISQERAVEEPGRDPGVMEQPCDEDAGLPSGRKSDDQTDRGEIHTPTLGELYARQGHYEKAVEIYENLLQDEPWNQTYQQRLDELKKTMMQAPMRETAEEKEEEYPPAEVWPVSRTSVIHHLENCLERIRDEKEKRCSKNC